MAKEKAEKRKKKENARKKERQRKKKKILTTKWVTAEQIWHSFLGGGGR